MKPIILIAAALILGLTLGCGRGYRSRVNSMSDTPPRDVAANQTAGNQNRTIATAVGMVVGGVASSGMGRSLSEADRRAAMAAEYRALEYGTAGVAAPWSNPQSGHHGTVVADKPYVSGNQYCRVYAHSIFIGAQPQTMKGKACREPDGTWRSVG